MVQQSSLDLSQRQSHSPEDDRSQSPDRERRRIVVAGVVQGVGFRPFVYGLAAQLDLTGFVGNDSSGVFIEIEGPPAAITAFQQKLRAEAPPLAHIESVAVGTMAPRGDAAFNIVASEAGLERNTLISPDVSICNQCLHEILDATDRRYRYPFTNCTNCGPRFTIIRDIPYDRPSTTMADFVMCPACQAEYDDPLNRRFHAQPNACPVCGPQVAFQWSQRSQRSQRSQWSQWSPAASTRPPEETIDPIARLQKEGRPDADPIALAHMVIARGGIVAVKGLGGFHLACDAANDQAVQTLRRRKGRVDKPFAVMALNIETVAQFAEVNPEEEALLTGQERPIVLLKKKPTALLSNLIAPGNPYIGVMLPYTPLHYLLLTPVPAGERSPETGDQKELEKLPPASPPGSTRNRRGSEQRPGATLHSPISLSLDGPILVMTSGNFSDEPIVKDNDEALERLSTLADAFLLHNRDIHAPCDDSVIRVFAGRELPVRRSRGYAPFPVRLPFTARPTLAVGGELKATFCLAKGNYAYMSQHIGDMENLETLQAFEKATAHFQAIFRVAPEIIAYDMHPAYLSSRWAGEIAGGKRPIAAEESASPLNPINPINPTSGERPPAGEQANSLPGRAGQLPSPASERNAKPGSPIPDEVRGKRVEATKIEVQHHHAHIAAVMAENGHTGRTPVLGFSFDGTGYGPDGAIWGGELLVADYQGFRRAAHLKYVPLPGGDAAVKRPYRTALAHLWAAEVPWVETLPPVAACPAVERGIIKRQLDTGLNAVPTSSMGRLFDAVASLAGGRQTVTYEAQAAIEFEALVAPEETERYQFRFSPGPEGVIEIEAGPVIRDIAADLQAGLSTAMISAKFHNAVAGLILDLSVRLRDRAGLRQVALSGGVFQNVTLLDRTVKRLRSAHFEIITHRLVPPNDGGLALGQAVISCQGAVANNR